MLLLYTTFCWRLPSYLNLWVARLMIHNSRKTQTRQQGNAWLPYSLVWALQLFCHTKYCSPLMLHVFIVSFSQCAMSHNIEGGEPGISLCLTQVSSLKLC